MFIYRKFSHAIWSHPFWVVTITCMCFLAACTSKKTDASLDPVTDPPLTTVVSDLKIVATEADKVTISWTAPATNGEDLYYQIRHSEDSLTTANWLSGVICSYVPPVADSGVTQSYDVVGLPAGKLSYIAVRISSASGSFGPVSENVSDTLPSLLTRSTSQNVSGTAIVTSDLDSDGDIDIAIGGVASIHILMNDGTGRFTENQALSLDVNVKVIRAADFNNDGYNDIAILSTTHVRVLTNDGTGLFSTTCYWDIGQMGRAMQVGDFNGDGFTDIIASSADYGGKFSGFSCLMAIYFNDETGGFGDVDTVNNIIHVSSICVFDADDDGDIDIATDYHVDNTIWILYNNGTGRDWNDNHCVNMGNPISSVTHGDLTNDGRTDLAGSSGDMTMVAVRNDGGSYSLVISTPGAGDGSNCRLGDFDGDGFLDIARGYSTLTLHLNDGQGGFDGAACYDAGSDVDQLALAVADFDKDGHPDVAVLQPTEKLLIFLSTL